MRPQEQAIRDAMSGGAFRVDVPFLTTAEVLELVPVAISLLGGPGVHKAGFNATTLKNWLNRDIFLPHNRNEELRNYLYGTIDVAILATIQHLSDFGLPLIVAADVARNLPKLLSSVDTLEFDPADSLLFVRMVEDGYVTTVPDFGNKKSADLQRYMAKHHVPTVLAFDWKRAIEVSICVCQDRWKTKAEALAGKMQAYLKGRSKLKG
jgi:hypothetical protein